MMGRKKMREDKLTIVKDIRDRGRKINLFHTQLNNNEENDKIKD
jgi:hypothetical protein